MNKGAAILAIIMGAALFGTSYASTKGIGVPQPDKEPPSIREGSVRTTGSGHYRTRYFVGGGLLYGK